MFTIELVRRRVSELKVIRASFSLSLRIWIGVRYIPALQGISAVCGNPYIDQDNYRERIHEIEDQAHV